MNPEIFGSIAAVLTTAAYVPQALKVYREKQTKNLSLGMYSLISTGLFFWLIYGVMMESPSLILANSITLALSCFILCMKIRHG
jgi:MtN3 and saliva related transmembrane protein